MRITAACPESLVKDANQLAMCLAFSVADGNTFDLSSKWEDKDGNIYAAASWEADLEWIDKAVQPLTRPSWDTENIIDMNAAERAQSFLIYTTEKVSASTNNIVAIGGIDGPEAIASLGIFQNINI